MICQGIVREMSGNFGPTQMWQPCTYVVNLQIPLTGYGGISQVELEGMNKGQSGNFWASIGHPKVGQNDVVEVNVRNTGDRAAFVKALPFKGMFTDACRIM